MRSSARTERRASNCAAAPALVALTVAALAAAPLPFDAWAQTEPAGRTQPGHFQIVDATGRVDGPMLLLDADVTLEFSSDALEAIENGVPVSVLMEMEVVRERPVFNEVVSRPAVALRIENNPLTKQYAIRNLADGTTRTFRSRSRMVSALGRMRGLDVIALDELSPRDRYSVRVRARLDIEALPAPLRPLAYLSPSWRLRSEWYTTSLPRAGDNSVGRPGG